MCLGWGGGGGGGGGLQPLQFQAMSPVCLSYVGHMFMFGNSPMCGIYHKPYKQGLILWACQHEFI